MEVIENMKEERSYTFQHIADLLGSSVGHMQNVYHGRVGLGINLTSRAKIVARLLHLIDGAPSDVILLKYELSQLTGLSMEELEQAETKAEKRGIMKSLPEAPKQPTIKKANLRMCTIECLENIRDNGYESLSRAGVYFDRGEIDGEIKRKIDSKRFRGFKYAKVMENHRKSQELTK